jgi:hypothetical protein
MNAEPDYEGGVYRMVTGVCSKDSTLIDYLFNFVKPNEEILQRFNFAADTKMRNILLSTFEIIEIDGIFDTKVIKVEDGKSREIGLRDSIPSLANEYGSRYLDVYYNSSNSDICNGCITNVSICIPSGSGFGTRYCDADSILRDKKVKGSLCSGNYECVTNLCDKKCIEQGLITNIGNWLKGLFG